MGRLGQTAEAIAAHYGMEPELMEGYHVLINATLKKAELEKQGSSFNDAEQAKELIYEVNELIMTEDCIEINYHLAYCQNCGEGGINGTLDLLSLLGCNLYDVHFTCDDNDGTPVSRLSADMLTEEGKREWADVLSAKVESITFENESFKCKLANCDPERLNP